MNKLKLTGNVIYGFAVVVLLVLSAVLALPFVGDSRGVYSYVVLSGSMEPAIRKGSVVLVDQKEEYHENDIVTFNRPGNTTVTNTHRVYGVTEEDGVALYETKGDANEAPDPQRIPYERILGKVIFTMPLIGYPISFAKTQIGFIILIVIPATLIIVSEFNKIKSEVVSKLGSKDKNEKSN